MPGSLLLCCWGDVALFLDSVEITAHFNPKLVALAEFLPVRGVYSLAKWMIRWIYGPYVDCWLWLWLCGVLSASIRTDVTASVCFLICFAFKVDLHEAKLQGSFFSQHFRFFFFKGRNLVIGIVYWLNGLFWVYAECWWICTVWALKSTFWQSRRMFNTWIQHQTVAETSSFILYLYAWHFVWVPAFVSFLCLPTVLYWRTDSTVESILELRPSHKRPYLSFAVFLFLWCALNFLCI